MAAGDSGGATGLRPDPRFLLEDSLMRQAFVSRAVQQQPGQTPFAFHTLRFALFGLLAIGSLISEAQAQAPPAPPVSSSLTELQELLGAALFFDTTLSQPVGQACGSCHLPSTGFTFPDPIVNEILGPVPGAVQGRFGLRKPPTVAYASFMPQGPPAFNTALNKYVGGFFWDGRAATLTAQAALPFQNPNEMNNVVHGVGSPAQVVSKVQQGASAWLFEIVYGRNAFSQPTATVFAQIVAAIVAFENTEAVSPFDSKYDAYLAGEVMLSSTEMLGLQLFTGSTTGRPGGPANYKNAGCSGCHSIPSNASSGPDLFTNAGYSNTGVPRNPNNPYYTETNAQSNPQGYNPLGAAFVDYGLGAFLYPNQSLPSGNVGPGSNGQGDFLKVNGKFKTPTLRNVDKRPYAGFIKCFNHNGVFKSLADVVHFYNARNLTSMEGEVIDFTAANPYATLQGEPEFPPPEYPFNLANAAGTLAGVGNLGLTEDEEAAVVAFMQTLSDGYGFFGP